MALLFFNSCSLKPVSKHKNSVYDAAHDLKLDVYSPRKADKPKEVLIFIHGGNWRSGKKSLYRFFGKGMARKGIVSVVIQYRLSPLTDYDGMAKDAALAVKWVKENISSYKGDSTKLFISGHSAGAHLAALIVTDKHYFKDLNMENPIKGTILIDAFGLDMHKYLTVSQNPKDSIYYPIFSKNPETWKKASPIFHLRKDMPPFLMFVGTKTYPAIKMTTDYFLKALQPYQPNTPLIEVNGKRHAGMIFQFYNPRKKAYKDVLGFIKETSEKK